MQGKENHFFYDILILLKCLERGGLIVAVIAGDYPTTFALYMYNFFLSCSFKSKLFVLNQFGPTYYVFHVIFIQTSIFTVGAGSLSDLLRFADI